MRLWNYKDTFNPEYLPLIEEPNSSIMNLHRYNIIYQVNHHQLTSHPSSHSRSWTTQSKPESRTELSRKIMLHASCNKSNFINFHFSIEKSVLIVQTETQECWPVSVCRVCTKVEQILQSSEKSVQYLELFRKYWSERTLNLVLSHFRHVN